MILHTVVGLLKFGITFSGLVCSPEGYSTIQNRTCRQQLEAIYRRKRNKLLQHVNHTTKKLQSAENALRDYDVGCTEMLMAMRFTPKHFGYGHVGGGSPLHKQKRLLALDKLRHQSKLTTHQLGRWEHFATAWDTRMSEEHKADWGKLFVEILQDLWIRTAHNGEWYALSVYMEHETIRVFHGERALVMAHERDTRA